MTRRVILPGDDGPDDNAALSAEQIEEGICNALAAGDVRAAVDMLRVLATVDPHRAALVHQAMQWGIAWHPSRRTGDDR